MAVCPVYAIDSNATGLRWTFEECPGVLPANPVWREVPPNSYGDFGGQNTKVTRNPIKRDRQNLKGTVVDRVASAAFQFDVNDADLKPFLPGFFFADWRVKASYLYNGAAGLISVVAATAGAFPALVGTGAVDFTTLGLIPGEWVYVGGDATASRFNNDENNGFKRVRAITAQRITFDKTISPMSAEAGTGKTISIYMGQVLKNESTPSLIKKMTAQFENSLGSLDGLEPSQHRYVEGGYFNEMTINLATADKATVDLAFVALRQSLRTAAEGPKPGTRPVADVGDVYNTTSHFRRMKISRINGFTGANDPLTAFFQTATLTLNNGVALTKGIGVMGGFDSSTGNFNPGGTLTGYFTTVEAIRAIDNNEDLTFDAIAVNGSNGFVYDLPIIEIGDGRPTITLNEKVTLPMTMNASTGARIDQSLNHTAMWISFSNLPAIAASQP